MRILAKTIFPSAVGTLCLAWPDLAVRAQTVEPGPSVSGVRVEIVDGKPRYTNGLIEAKSPYLLLHAALRVGRLFHVPLVPRDGAGVVLRSGHRVYL
jgi:hypothetical protein